MFVEDDEVELQKKGDRTWTPAQPQYDPYFPNTYVHSLIGGRDICPTSRIRAEVLIMSGHSFWAKYREASEAIELDGLFNQYWSSSDNEFPLLR